MISVLQIRRSMVQYTTTWYVDDLKILHMESSAVDGVKKTIEPHFGKMNVTRGNTHTYTITGIEFIGNVKVISFQK